MIRVGAGQEDSIAPSASPLLEPKRRTGCWSVRATSAGGICSAGSSTSTTAPPHDRIRVSDPHGVKPTPGSQLALLTLYDFHAFITDRVGTTLELEADPASPSRGFGRSRC
jgi:hypothetical protein